MASVRERFGRPLRLGIIGGGPDAWIGRMHRGAAAGAGDVVGLDHDFDARQVVGQRSPAGAALRGTRLPQGRVGLLLLGLCLGDRLLEILQPQVELLGIEFLGTFAELHPLQLAD